MSEENQLFDERIIRVHIPRGLKLSQIKAAFTNEMHLKCVLTEHLEDTNYPFSLNKHTPKDSVLNVPKSVQPCISLAEEGWSIASGTGNGNGNGNGNSDSKVYVYVNIINTPINSDVDVEYI
jgi:hypothetical protein